MSNHDYELIKSSSVIWSSQLSASHSLVVVTWLKVKPLNRLLIASTRRSCANALVLKFSMMYGVKWFIKLEHKGDSNPCHTSCLWNITDVTHSLCAYACMLMCLERRIKASFELSDGKRFCIRIEPRS